MNITTKKTLNQLIASALVAITLGFNTFAHAQMIAMADVEPTYSSSDDLKVIPPSTT